MGYSQAQKVQGHEKILDIAGLQPGSAKSDVRCSPCASKVIHDLDAVIVVLYRGLGSPFNFNALKVRPHKKLSPPRHQFTIENTLPLWKRLGLHPVVFQSQYSVSFYYECSGRQRSPWEKGSR